MKNKETVEQTVPNELTMQAFERGRMVYLLRSDSEVLLDEIKGNAKGHKGDQEHGCRVGDHPDSGQAEQGGSGQRLQGWRDVLRRESKGQSSQLMRSTHGSVIKY